MFTQLTKIQHEVTELKTKVNLLMKERDEMRTPPKVVTDEEMLALQQKAELIKKKQKLNI